MKPILTAVELIPTELLIWTKVMLIWTTKLLGGGGYFDGEEGGDTAHDVEETVAPSNGSSFLVTMKVVPVAMDMVAVVLAVVVRVIRQIVSSRSTIMRPRMPVEADIF